ncbi:DUF1453 family protein [Lysinibacillus agricola]|uniref:DUF1453 family protein n=1 Tax=Lysinibacillus agricola TaxID=2590012 RepID=A0ABX7B149_9BACI|nr:MULTISPECIES: CcdC protein domain-containing protein [Lysinibacillus]KOS63496.1 hypothetical protein AN161_07515 [Lysinibacillus sp. FJAT-14222]QQP14164.1 DUF1453 family protein [Lysinibacillus agricola]
MSSYLVVFIVIVLIMLREKQVRPARLWIIPVLLMGVMFSTISSIKLTPLSIVMYISCLIVGLSIGVWKGKLEKIRMNHTRGIVTTQSSIAGIILFFGILLVRLFVGHWSRELALLSLTNALMFIPLGSICSRRYIIYLRYKQLMGE